MSLTKIENTNANTETNGKKARKPRETKTSFENAAKLAGFKDQREVASAIMHAVVFFAQHNSQNLDFATRRKVNVALKVATEYNKLQQRSTLEIGKDAETENAAMLADLAPLF